MEDNSKPRKMKPLKPLLLGGAVVAIIAALGVAAYFGGRATVSGTAGSPATGDSEVDYRVLDDVVELLGRNYVTPRNVNEQQLYEAAIQSLLGVLNDSGTFYVDAAHRSVDPSQAGTYNDVGVTLAAVKEEIALAQVVADSPAGRAGLVAGDILLAIDGTPVKGWTTQKASVNVRGNEGTEVTLSVRRADSSERDFSLSRTRVQAPAVSTAIPGGALRDSSGATVNNVAYIQLRDLTSRTPQDLEAAIKDLVSKGARGLILDLRGNAGGTQDAGIGAADLLLDNGIILYHRDANGKETPFPAKKGVVTDLPVAVLINKFSAGGSEIIAASLADNDRATLIGETSSGFGVVNVQRKLPDGGVLYVTTAQWLTPTGTIIDRVGVRPDIELSPRAEDIAQNRDVQLQRALDVLRGQVRAQ